MKQYITILTEAEVNLIRGALLKLSVDKMEQAEELMEEHWPTKAKECGKVSQQLDKLRCAFSTPSERLKEFTPSMQRVVADMIKSMEQ